MFDVEGTTIRMSRGDTGAVRFRVTAKYKGTDTPYNFGENDRAVFSIKDSTGSLVKEKYCPIVDNAYIVVFYNADTDTVSPGNFSWDVRYVINPYYNSAGKIVDGDQVVTPTMPQTMNLLSVVGDI